MTVRTHNVSVSAPVHPLAAAQALREALAAYDSLEPYGTARAAVATAVFGKSALAAIEALDRLAAIAARGPK